MPHRSSLVLVPCAALALAAGTSSSALGQLVLTHPPREAMDMPPGVPATAAGAAYTYTIDGVGDGVPPVFVRQVNVNAAGQNVLNDAGNEPSIAVDPTAPNRLCVGWRQFDTISSNFRQAGRAYSRDGGRTWINPGPLQPGVFRSDPVLRQTRTGRFYYLSLTNTGPGLGFSCQTFTSSDGGATFTGPVQAVGGDKQWFEVDRTGGPGDGFLHQSWSLGGFGDEAYSRSIDQGATWLTPFSPPAPVWGTLAINSAGTLYIGGIDFAGSNTTSLRCARSANANNGGVTPTFITTLAPIGGNVGFSVNPGPNPGGLLGQVQIAVDTSGGPRNGWVYMLSSVNPAGTDPLDVNFQRSTDGGQTWLASPIRVNNDPQGANAWQWFGTMSIAPNGRLDVVWLDTRESQNFRLSRLYYASSSDGGATWQGNVAISPQFDSNIGWPQQNKMGDYFDMQSDRVGADLAWAATFTGGQDVYYARIGDWDCNGNGIGDTAEITADPSLDCDNDGNLDSCELAAGTPVNCVCYANCDGSTGNPLLTPADFVCFLNRYRAGDPYANCDGSTGTPSLTPADFVCFLNRFRAGC